jgi:DNA-binding MarR family transcriptional regulator
MSRDSAARDFPEPSRGTSVVSTTEPRTTEQRKQWRNARHFQRRVQKALQPTGLTFLTWLLLEALHELLEETKEPVSQQAVAERAGISKALASYWMVGMEEDCFIDRGLGEDPRSYLILMLDEGSEVLAHSRRVLQRAGLTDESRAASP